MRRYAGDLKGFTLLELVISAGILISVLYGSIAAVVGFISLSDVARDKTFAVNDARKIMEQIQSTPFVQVKTTIENTDWTNWLVNNNGAGLNSEQVNVSAADDTSVPNLLDITVTVIWQTRNRPMSVSLVTSRADI